MYSGVDAWRVIELQASQGSGGYGEFLLVFQTLAIYVDIQGRKSRDREIMYPAVPTHISEFTNKWLIQSMKSLNVLIQFIIISILRWTFTCLFGYSS
jgi:serine/threonine-protein kinase MRCK